MKKIIVTAIAVLAVFALALATTACDDGTGGGTTHTHTYSTTWSSNATQHWHECTANDGAKTDIANHTGDPCAVCEYTASVNQPLTANAGTDQTHTLANNLTITLNGADSAGNITAYAWECLSYTADQGAVSAEYTPAQVDALIANANTATATVAPRKAGTYTFKLTVTATNGDTATDNVTVVVEGYTVTTTIGVEGISQTGGAAVLNFTPVYTSTNTTDFPVADIGNYITYTVTATGVKAGTSDSFTYTMTNGVNNFDGKVSFHNDYNTAWVTFTQTFYDKDGQNLNKNRTLIAMWYGTTFMYFDDDDTWNENLSIPSVSGISLSKTITE
jgi:hypothetical protein